MSKFEHWCVACTRVLYTPSLTRTKSTMLQHRNVRSMVLVQKLCRPVTVMT